MKPDRVALWIPRGDEHALAASLGLCDPDPRRLRELVEAAQAQLARDLPGVPVRVGRWHVWRIVRALARAGLTNTPDSRAAAFALLAGEDLPHERPSAP